jgi:predicted DNA-binding ribbon-helix-helix protein
MEALMDGRTKTGSRPKSREEPARYDRDLYSWALEQAALLRAGRIAEADALNIAEEIDDVGNEQYDKLESALRVILVHLLKWDHQPQRRSHSWWSSITVQRNHARRVLLKNPGLKPRTESAVLTAYEDARAEAAGETRLRPQTFPAKCPYSWAEIMERPIDWPSAD